MTIAILKFTPKDPRMGLNFITEALKATPTGVLNYQGRNSYLNQAGISIEPSPLKAPGTILPPFHMSFKDKPDVVGTPYYIGGQDAKSFH